MGEGGRGGNLEQALSDDEMINFGVSEILLFIYFEVTDL